jgi:hypothetical protein
MSNVRQPPAPWLEMTPHGLNAGRLARGTTVAVSQAPTVSSLNCRAALLADITSQAVAFWRLSPRPNLHSSDR